MIAYQVTINGISVTASYSAQAIDEIFLPLLRNLTGIQKKKGRRILVMLAAPPGAGKSTLLSFLEHLTNELLTWEISKQSVWMASTKDRSIWPAILFSATAKRYQW